MGLDVIRSRAALFLSRIVLRLVSSSLISGTLPSGLDQIERVVVMISTPNSINVMILEASPIMARASAIFARRWASRRRRIAGRNEGNSTLRSATSAECGPGHTLEAFHVIHAALQKDIAHSELQSSPSSAIIFHVCRISNKFSRPASRVCANESMPVP